MNRPDLLSAGINAAAPSADERNVFTSPASKGLRKGARMVEENPVELGLEFPPFALAGAAGVSILGSGGLSRRFAKPCLSL